MKKSNNEPVIFDFRHTAVAAANSAYRPSSEDDRKYQESLRNIARLRAFQLKKRELLTHE